MLTDKEFIMLVRKYEILYNNKPDIKDTKTSIWQLIAKESGLNGADIAEFKWKQLVEGYVKYLRTGITFSDANDMSFLQPHLICFESGMDEFTDQELTQLKNLLEYVEADENELSQCNENLKTVSTMSQVENANAPSTHLKDLTSLELIFIGYAKALQKMPPALRVATKRKIADIMDEAELKMDEQIHQ